MQEYDQGLYRDIEDMEEYERAGGNIEQGFLEEQHSAESAALRLGSGGGTGRTTTSNKKNSGSWTKVHPRGL
jgi:hypothetical protein